MGFLSDATRTLFGGSQSRSSSGSYIDPMQRPYLRDIYGEAQRLYGAQNPYGEYANQALFERGFGGSPYNQAAGASLMQTLQGQPGFTPSGYQQPSFMMNRYQEAPSAEQRGEFLPGGEQFDRYVQAMYRQQRPTLDSQFEAGGRYGSGLHRLGAEQRMADIGMGAFQAERGRMSDAEQAFRNRALQGFMSDEGRRLQAHEGAQGRELQAYLGDEGRRLIAHEGERGRQMQAAGLLPRLAGQDYRDIEAMRQAGGYDWDLLSRYRSMIGQPTVLSRSQSTGDSLQGIFQPISLGGGMMSMFGG